MEKTALNIMVLCKVLDNYGDIGVAHRLCMELKELLEIGDGGKEGQTASCRPNSGRGCTGQNSTITLVVNSLKTYRTIFPEVREGVEVQNALGITVVDWNAHETATFCRPDVRSARQNSPAVPSVILQCFQCGYPEWLEDMLFGKDAAQEVIVIDIDYLTAESWAGEFHKMRSLTRSCHVHKVLFMPGFTKETGGLLMQGRRRKAISKVLNNEHKNCINVLVFGYERDYSPLVHALGKLYADIKSGGASGTDGHAADMRVLAANGAGQKSFLKAWANKAFPAEAMPFVEQKEWDKILLDADIAFVRGEDSLAGAALAGAPFVWEAYRQEEETRIAKVRSLLDVMRPYFLPQQYELVSRLYLMWNREDNQCNADGFLPTDNNDAYELLYQFMQQRETLAPCFAQFAASLESNGDLAVNLLEYIETLVKQYCL